MTDPIRDLERRPDYERANRDEAGRGLAEDPKRRVSDAHHSYYNPPGSQDRESRLMRISTRQPAWVDRLIAKGLWR
jgi:hypothetical protein